MSVGALAGWQCRVVASDCPPCVCSLAPRPIHHPPERRVHVQQRLATPQQRRKLRERPIPSPAPRAVPRPNRDGAVGLGWSTPPDEYPMQRGRDGPSAPPQWGPRASVSLLPHAGAWMHPLFPARRCLVRAVLAVHRQPGYNQTSATREHVYTVYSTSHHEA